MAIYIIINQLPIINTTPNIQAREYSRDETTGQWTLDGGFMSYHCGVHDDYDGVHDDYDGVHDEYDGVHYDDHGVHDATLSISI